MNKIKVKLDRETLSSDYIESKQDFKHVTNQVLSSTSLLKSTWFYGSIGLASLATIVTLSVKTTQTPLNEETSTLKNTITTASFLATTTPKTSTKEKKTVPSADKQVSVKREPLVEVRKVPATIPVPSTEKKTQPVVKQLDVNEKTVVIHQAYTLPEKEPVKKSYIPKINGVYSGEIAIQQLCGSGIEVNSEVEVTSFTLNYSSNRGDKAVKVNGNTVPSTICNEMYSYGIDQMIFITDIIGEDISGKILRFVPMNLTAVIH